MKHSISKDSWIAIGSQMGWMKRFAASIDKYDDEVLAAWVRNHAPLYELAKQSVPESKIGDITSPLFMQFLSSNRDYLAKAIQEFIGQGQS